MVCRLFLLFSLFYLQFYASLGMFQLFFVSNFVCIIIILFHYVKLCCFSSMIIFIGNTNKPMTLSLFLLESLSVSTFDAYQRYYPHFYQYLWQFEYPFLLNLGILIKVIIIPTYPIKMINIMLHIFINIIITKSLNDVRLWFYHTPLYQTHL